MSTKLVLATGNEGKLRELRLGLAGLDTELVAATELGLGKGPEETGSTYEENALIKAAWAAHRTGLAALADDSGIEVDALGGAPGVHSARFGGALSPGERIAHLLQRIKQVPREGRGARFVSVVVLATPNGVVKVFRGSCRGEVLFGPRGEAGHGYDPIFWSNDLQKSFAEASEQEKHAVSHRGRALRALLDWAGGERSWLVKVSPDGSG